MRVAMLKGSEIFILRPHERIRLSNLAKVGLEMIVRRGIIEKPILVEKNHFVILDGHHRVTVAKLFGLPLKAIFVDYDEVELAYWGKMRPSKRDVVEAALEGRLFPPKTTKHVIKEEVFAQFQ